MESIETLEFPDCAQCPVTVIKHRDRQDTYPLVDLGAQRKHFRPNLSTFFFIDFLLFPLQVFFSIMEDKCKDDDYSVWIVHCLYVCMCECFRACKRDRGKERMRQQMNV